MSAASGATFALVRKEVFEILRTWRRVVLPVILLLFAVSGPLLAKFTPEIVAALAGDQLGGLKLPEPTVFQAYGEWIKNLSQIGAFALIIIYGGIVSAERRSGTAVLVLTKPASRLAFVVVKFAVHLGYLAVLLAAGTAVTWGTTAIVFGRAPAGALWAASGTWALLGALYLALMVLFSVLIRAAAGAAGAGLGAYVLIAVASAFTKIGDYSPAGLVTRAPQLAAQADVGGMLWPVLTTVAAAVLAVGAAALVFRRQEL